MPPKRNRRLLRPRPFRLTKIEIENLRGFSNASLTIGPTTILVGENNQGKSSALKLADWLLNQADDALFLGQRYLTVTEQRLLVPANSARHRARRLSLYFTPDRTNWPSIFDRLSMQSRLRISIRTSQEKVLLNGGPPTRSESESDKNAIEYLGHIRRRLSFKLIPAARDAASIGFAEFFERRIRKLLIDKFNPTTQGAGARAEYRVARAFINDVKPRVDKAAEEIWKSLLQYLPTGLAAGGSLKCEADAKSVAEWLRTTVVLALTTGQHDSLHVPASEVGNGLQSMLEVALVLAEEHSTAKRSHVILALEEPEAFLHPSAQRVLLRQLRAFSLSGKRSVVLTTHSPYILDESKYGEVVIVRNHNYFHPTANDDRRSEINTSLMSTRAAEVFFAQSVLIVEGPGDVAFFDTLLKRLLTATSDPALARCTVISAGGKTSFAPWIRLFRSYEVGIRRPIEWISLLDADAASNTDGRRTVLQTISDGGYRISPVLLKAITTFGDLDHLDTRRRLALVNRLNKELSNVACRLFSIDLEWAIFNGADESILRKAIEILEENWPEQGLSDVDVARKWGSKIQAGSASKNAAKAPYMRQKIAEIVDLDCLSSEVKGVLRSWFESQSPSSAVRSLIR